MKTLLRFPPRVVRLLARVGSNRNVRMLTNREIAQRSGLTERRVRTISSKVSWLSVNVGDMLAYMRGCGFDPDRTARQAEYLRRTLNLRRTRKPLAYASRSSVTPPSPSQLVDAAVGRRLPAASSGALAS